MIEKDKIKLFFSLILILFTAFFLTLVISPNTVKVGSVSLFVICALIVFIIQWIAFIPAFLFRSEYFLI